MGFETLLVFAETSLENLQTAWEEFLLQTPLEWKTEFSLNSTWVKSTKPCLAAGPQCLAVSKVNLECRIKKLYEVLMFYHQPTVLMYCALQFSWYLLLHKLCCVFPHNTMSLWKITSPWWWKEIAKRNRFIFFNKGSLWRNRSRCWFQDILDTCSSGHWTNLFSLEGVILPVISYPEKFCCTIQAGFFLVW